MNKYPIKPTKIGYSFLFYDENNSLLYVTGKKTTMFAYEIQGKNIIQLKGVNVSDGVGTCAMIPQRTYDVKKCEIGRFLLMNQKNDMLFNISFALNRRDGDSIYQEDLYQNIKSMQPEYPNAPPEPASRFQTLLLS